MDQKWSSLPSLSSCEIPFWSHCFQSNLVPLLSKHLCGIQPLLLSAALQTQGERNVEGHCETFGKRFQPKLWQRLLGISRPFPSNNQNRRSFWKRAGISSGLALRMRSGTDVSLVTLLRFCPKNSSFVQLTECVDNKTSPFWCSCGIIRIFPSRMHVNFLHSCSWCKMRSLNRSNVGMQWFMEMLHTVVLVGSTTTVLRTDQFIHSRLLVETDCTACAGGGDKSVCVCVWLLHLCVSKRRKNSWPVWPQNRFPNRTLDFVPPSLKATRQSMC